MKKYVLSIENDDSNFEQVEDRYFTGDGLNQFLEIFEAEFKNNYPNERFVKNENCILVGTQTEISWKEYKTPKEPTFKGKVENPYKDVSFGDSGYESTYLNIEIY